MAAPLPSFPPALLARLEAYGSYSSHQPSLLARWIGVPAEIEWESPAGFENDLAPIAVTLWFSPGKSREADMTRLLDALDEFRRHLAEHIQDLKSLVVGAFRDAFERELTDFVRQRLASDSETIPDSAILREVTAVRFRFDATGNKIIRTAGVVSEWSHEDGLTVEWDEIDGTISPAAE